MDPRTPLRIAALLAVALAGGCTPAEFATAVRQALRATTQLIRVADAAPPPPASVTTGVRG